MIFKYNLKIIYFHEIKNDNLMEYQIIINEVQKS